MSARAFNLLRSVPAGVVDDAGLRVSHDFTNMSALPSSIAFSRTTKAWDYQLREYAIDEPRLVHGEGLLIEEQRPNKCENYNAFPTTLSDFVGTGGYTTDQSSGQDASFDLLEPGVLPPLKDVHRVVRITAGTDGGAGIRFGGVGGNTNPHSLSIWVRCGPGALAWLYYESASTRTEYDGSAWKRITLENTAALGDNRGMNVFNARAGKTWIDVIVPQLEEGAFATSPIVTSGAALTRSTDAASEPLPPLSGDGTFTVSWRHESGPQLPNVAVAVDLGRISPAEIIRMGWDSSQQVQATYVLSGTQTNMRQDSPTMATYAGEVLEGTFAFATNDFEFVLNGQTQTDATGTVGPVQGNIIYGAGVDNVPSRIGNCYIRTFTLWDRVL